MVIDQEVDSSWVCWPLQANNWSDSADFELVKDISFVLSAFTTSKLS